MVMSVFTGRSGDTCWPVILSPFTCCDTTHTYSIHKFSMNLFPEFYLSGCLHTSNPTSHFLRSSFSQLVTRKYYCKCTALLWLGGSSAWKTKLRARKSQPHFFRADWPIRRSVDLVHIETTGWILMRHLDQNLKFKWSVWCYFIYIYLYILNKSHVQIQTNNMLVRLSIPSQYHHVCGSQPIGSS